MTRSSPHPPSSGVVDMGQGAAGWWHRASQDQKLRQLDAGIELGLTARAVAVCSGLTRFVGNAAALHTFARDHGRNFPAENSRVGASGRARKRVNDLRREMTDTDKLRAILALQNEALNRAGAFLAEVGQSRSKYADEAWGCFSQLINVAHQVNELMAADAADANRLN